MTRSREEVNEAYSINTYGAVIEVEQAVEMLREAHENGDDETVGRALACFEDIVPTLKTAVGVRYSGNTDWIPFDTIEEDATLWLLEYDSNDSRRVRRRAIARADIPPAGDSE